MSAGNLIGSLWNTLFFGGLWVVLGAALDKIFKAFNSSMAVLPTLQDAVNGMGIIQTIWASILVVIFFVVWINYLMNENSLASGGV